MIGNENYAPSVGPLSNPQNDVARLGAALQKIGFEVTTVNNAGFAQRNGAVSAYARKLSAGGQRAIGFFYYSGHGAQNKENGVNYLIPTDVKSVDAELWDYSVPLKSVTDTMRERAPNATHFVVFDACRNSLKLKEPGSKALMQSKGFEPVRAVSGMLVAYATAEGETASDLGSGGGPYSTALADEIVKPGIEAVAMFRKVQLRVHASIGQEPWLSYGTIGEIWFAGREERAAAPAPSAQSMAPARLSEAAEAWGATKDATSIPMLELFIASFKDTYYAGLARLRIEELKRQQVAVAAPTKVPAPPTQADLPKLAAPVSPSDPKTVPRAVQLELARLGCFAGTPSGDWGPKTREALRRFNKRAPKAVAVTGDPAGVDISVLRAVNAPLCPTQDCSSEVPISGFSKMKHAFDEAVLKELRKSDPRAKASERWTNHDLRRTARSLMSRAGVQPNHAERALGHVIAGVQGTYDRYEYAAEKRQAFEALAAQIARILNPRNNVIPMNAVRTT